MSGVVSPACALDGKDAWMGAIRDFSRVVLPGSSVRCSVAWPAWLTARPTTAGSHGRLVIAAMRAVG